MASPEHRFEEHDETRPEMPWSETDSAAFKDVGRILIPRRDEIERIVARLVPGDGEEAFVGVDIAAGTGWLSNAILSRYPGSRMIVLDGSETMLEEARRSLAGYDGRFELRRFRLEDPSWLSDLPDNVRCVVSSLAIHHLDDAGKRVLFARVFDRLAPGGALLIADLVRPASEPARMLAAEEWDAEVRRQSLEIAGNLDAYEFFVKERWNIFEHPDPADMPSTIADQLRWLADIGYQGADVFWARAGHAIYGGFRP